MAEVDVLVIGGGPGGYVAAIRAAQLGKRVAVAEKRPALGGTCLNVGCIPSKALLHASEIYAEAAGGAWSRFGIGLGAVSLDLPAMLAEKDRAVEELTRGVAFLLSKNRIGWLKGHARITAPGVARVGEEEVRARDIVIATGSEAAFPPGLAPDGALVVSSTEALAFERVPEHLLVVGGGYIGLELGSVWRRLGARVTVVEYLDRILPGMDLEVSSEVARILTRQGLVLRTGTRVSGIEETDGRARVTLEPAADGPAEVLEADRVLLATGRRPHTEGLGLEAVGLSTDNQGRIPVGPDFRTAAAGIWAIGDVIEGPMLAHRAMDEGHAVAETICGRRGLTNRAVIPAVVYTQPEVASVGLTEAEAEAAGHQVRVGRFPFLANSRAKTIRDTTGFVKIVADAASDRVLGVHIVNRYAGTMIAEAAQAMEFGASAEDIALTCHAHPTHSEAVKEAALAATGQAIHI